MAARLPHNEIRLMVRELLRDLVGDGGGGAASGEKARATTESASTRPAINPAEVGGLSERVRRALEGGGGIEVAIADDAELNAFAQQVALCALERDLLGAIASNRVRFRLAAGGGTGDRRQRMQDAAQPAAAAPQKNDGGAFHWERGLLSETKIAEIARSHDRLVLGRQALLTPLAWDRARNLGLQVVRMKS